LPTRCRIEAARLYQVMNLIAEMVIDSGTVARKIDQLTGLHRALAEAERGVDGGGAGAFQSSSSLMWRRKGKFRSRNSGVRIPVAGGRRREVGGRSRSLVGWSLIVMDQFNVLAPSLVEISHDIEQLNGEVATCLEVVSRRRTPQFTQTSQQFAE